MPAATWIEAPAPAAGRRLSAAGIPEPLASLLARRGVGDPDQARGFLEPRLDQIPPGALLPGLELAGARLLQAAESDRPILVVGDYDADGITATALVAAAMEACGVTVRTVLPHRIRDGYGFRVRHVEEAVATGCAAILTVDCGSTASKAAAAAIDAGLGLIVVDHHRPEAPPPGSALHLNPRVHGTDHPHRDLSAAGLAFLLASQLLRAAGREVPAERLAAVAAVGTIADMVPLTGPNRALAACGLRALAETPSPGLRALFGVARLREPFRAEDVSFRLGPRLNAAGRMTDAATALRLLMTRDAEEGRRLAEELERCNRERRREEERVVREAGESVAAREPLPRLVVAWNAGWHRGVVGIAAGRLARLHHRPVLLFSVADGLATGSGRSVHGIDLHEFLAPWSDRLLEFGGHGQAIGLTAPADGLADLVAEWEAAALQWSADRVGRSLSYELDLSVGALDPDLLTLLERLEPHGEGNPAPRIRIGPVTARERRTFGTGHLELLAADPDGTSVRIVAWRWADRAEVFVRPFEALGVLERDSWRGGVQLRLVDARPCR